jgi:hypothetical protein
MLIAALFFLEKKKKKSIDHSSFQEEHTDVFFSFTISLKKHNEDRVNKFPASR